MRQRKSPVNDPLLDIRLKSIGREAEGEFMEILLHMTKYRNMGAMVGGVYPEMSVLLNKIAKATTDFLWEEYAEEYTPTGRIVRFRNLTADSFPEYDPEIVDIVMKQVIMLPQMVKDTFEATHDEIILPIELSPTQYIHRTKEQATVIFAERLWKRKPRQRPKWDMGTTVIDVVKSVVAELMCLTI